MRSVLVAGLVLLVAGCAGMDITAPSVSLAGNYSLKAINGLPLPFTSLDNGSERDVLVADVLTMNSDGSYRDVGTYQVTTNSGVQMLQQAEVGTYSNINGSITFNDQTQGEVYQGSLSGSVLTEIVVGLTEVYQKD
jgi:hypothetical protein